MCGRFAIGIATFESLGVFLAAAGFDRGLLATVVGTAVPDLLTGRFNVAPGQDIAVLAGQPARFVVCRWGFFSGTVSGGHPRLPLINARAETLADRPAFATARRARRCLIPADGFYEWHREGRARRPFHFGLLDRTPFAFAGLYDDSFPGRAAEPGCCIVTVAANSLVAPVHDRMPAMLAPTAWAAWLGADDPDNAGALLAPFPPERMTGWPVAPLVNSAVAAGPACRAPVAGDASLQGELFD